MYIVCLVPMYTVGMVPMYTLGMVPMCTVGMVPMYTVGMVPMYTVGLVPMYTVGLVPMYNVGLVPMYNAVFLWPLLKDSVLLSDGNTTAMPAPVYVEDQRILGNCCGSIVAILFAMCIPFSTLYSRVVNILRNQRSRKLRFVNFWFS